MEITWLGHSCFRLRGRSAAVLTDPYATSAGYTLGKQTADIVTVSNTHPHHNASESIDGDPVVLDGPGEYEVKNIALTGFRTDHPVQGEPTQRNTAFLIEIEGVTICHLGDLANALNSEQIELAKDANVLLLPVGGHCTIGSAQAAQVISRIEPKLVIPMHFKTDVSTVELDPIDNFLHEMGLTETEPQPKLVVTLSSLPAEPTVIVLQYKN